MTWRILPERAMRAVTGVLMTFATSIVTSPVSAQEQDALVWKLGQLGLYLRDGAGGTINITCSDDAEEDKVHFEFTLPHAAGNTEFKAHLDEATGLGGRWGWYRTVNGVRQEDDFRPYLGRMNITYRSGGMDMVRADNYIRTVGELKTETIVIPKRFVFDAAQMYAYASEAHPGLSPQMDVFLPLLISDGDTFQITVSDGQTPKLDWRFDLKLTDDAKAASLAAAETFFSNCPIQKNLDPALGLLR